MSSSLPASSSQVHTIFTLHVDEVVSFCHLLLIISVFLISYCHGVLTHLRRWTEKCLRSIHLQQKGVVKSKISRLR